MESASSWRFFVAIKKAKILEKVKRLGQKGINLWIYTIRINPPTELPYRQPFPYVVNFYHTKQRQQR